MSRTIPKTHRRVAVNGTANGHAKPAAAPPLTPVPTVDPPADGRGTRGRFAEGNTFARGNPVNRKLAANRKALLAAVSEDDLKAVAGKLREQALGGDVAAARLLLEYVVGKAPQAPDPDRCDLEEWKLLDAGPTTARVLAAMMDAVHPEWAVEFVKSLTPLTYEGARERVFDAAKLVRHRILEEQRAKVGK